MEKKLLLVFLFCVFEANLVNAKLDNDLLSIYTAQNLSFSCLPYLSKDKIAVCDCVSCTGAEPNFKVRMCAFFEEAKKKGKADLLNGDLVNICSSGSICPNIPNKCCNPADSSPKVGKGCPLCLPAVKSGADTRGQHPSCLLAEYEAAQATPPRGLTSAETYAIFNEAIREARLHSKCVSYPLFKTAKTCDCEDCLQNENNLRDKLCKIGEKIRANDKIARRGYLTSSQYYRKFCDKKACPNIPNKCCATTSKTEAENPVDRNGCPSCIPVTENFGFGARCRRELQVLPQELKLKVYRLP